MKFGEVLGEFGGCIFQIIYSLLGIFIVVSLFVDPLWFIESFYSVYSTILIFLSIFLVIIGIILVILPKTRIYAPVPFFLSAFLIGLLTWTYLLFVTYSYWGPIVTGISLLFYGLGPVPMGILAMILDGEWLILLQIVGAGVLIISFYYVSGYIMDREDSKERQKEIIEFYDE